MSEASSLPQKWFQNFSTQHYTYYLTIKSLSEWALGAYEKIFVHLDRNPSRRYILGAIRASKRALSLAKRLKSEATGHPPQLRQLMELDYKFSIEMCMTLDRLIKLHYRESGEDEEKLTEMLFELERRYIAQTSQFVDEDDLDARLRRTTHALVEFGLRFLRLQVEGLTNPLKEARKSLEIDLEEIIARVTGFTDHIAFKEGRMVLAGDRKKRLTRDLIDNYDDCFAVQRKTINIFMKAFETVKSPGDADVEFDAKLINELEIIPIELNHVFFSSSKIMIDELIPEKVPFNRRY